MIKFLLNPHIKNLDLEMNMPQKVRHYLGHVQNQGFLGVIKYNRL